MQSKKSKTLKNIGLIKKNLKSLKSKKRLLKNKTPAIFLDRDGVINKENSNKQYQDPLNIINGSYKAVKKINQSGYLAVIVTNQSAVAKGIISIKKLENDHRKLENYFGMKGAYFDRIYYCPFYPKKDFKGSIKKYIKKSSYRKPNNGMLKKAIKELNIDIKKSYMLGDRYTDYLAAKKTKVKFLIIGNKFKMKGYKNFKNLKDGINSIL